MKITVTKVTSTIGAVAILVGAVFAYAALAADVNKNSIHTLQANIDRWRYLRIQYEQQEQNPSVKAEVERLQEQIDIAVAEIKSRQEKN